MTLETAMKGDKLMLRVIEAIYEGGVEGHKYQSGF